MQPLIATNTDLALLLAFIVLVFVVIGMVVDLIRTMPPKQTKGMATYKRRNIDMPHD